MLYSSHSYITIPYMAIYRAYLRVSTEQQSDASLEVQKEFLQSQQKNNFPDHSFAFYHEKQSGTTIEKRTQLLKLLEDLSAGDIIGFYDNSRLGRDTLNNQLVLIQTQEKNAQIQIAGRLVDPENPEDQLLFTISSAVSKYSRQSQHNKSIKGIEKKKSSGNWVFTSRLLGYEVTTKNGKVSVKIIEEEAEIIRFIFTKYAEGLSIFKITNLLNEAGFRNRSYTTFHNATIRRYILKPIYMGKYPLVGAGGDVGIEKIMNIDTELIKSNLYEPIVPEELWYEVFNSYKRLTRKHSRQFEYRWSAYELTSVIKCYYCNQTYVHSYHKSPSNKVNSNYSCRIHKKNCQQSRHTFRTDTMEKLFQELFKLAFVFKDKIFSFEERKTNSLKKSKSEIQAKVDELNLEIKESEKTIDNLVKAIKEGMSLKKIKTELDKETKINDSLLELKNDYSEKLVDINQDLSFLIDDFAEKRLIDFFAGTTQERRILHHEYIQYCAVQDDRMYVYFIHDVFIEIKLIKNRGYIIQSEFPIDIYFLNTETDIPKKNIHRIKKFEKPNNESINLYHIASGIINTKDLSVTFQKVTNANYFPKKVHAFFKTNDAKTYETENCIYSRDDVKFINARIKQISVELKQINTLIHKYKDPLIIAANQSSDA